MLWKEKCFCKQIKYPAPICSNHCKNLPRTKKTLRPLPLSSPGGLPFSSKKASGKKARSKSSQYTKIPRSIRTPKINHTPAPARFQNFFRRALSIKMECQPEKVCPYTSNFSPTCFSCFRLRGEKDDHLASGVKKVAHVFLLFRKLIRQKRERREVPRLSIFNTFARLGLHFLGNGRNAIL